MFIRGAAPTSGLSSEGLIRQIYVKESGDGVQAPLFKKQFKSPENGLIGLLTHDFSF